MYYYHLRYQRLYYWEPLMEYRIVTVETCPSLFCTVAATDDFGPKQLVHTSLRVQIGVKLRNKSSDLVMVAA